MGFFRKNQHNKDSSDSGLVLASIGGDRDAFAVIVKRYQSLLCSLAYSSVGDLKHSEDIAQEAFLEAWKKLDTLRDPEKLKSWLCGIVRFKVSHYLRKESRQPLKHADDIEETSEGAFKSQSSHTSPDNLESNAIKEQEQKLLWDTLEQLPENYRAPLILFYREHCSVEVVAEQLELSEDTAKQRLSRGRKLLQAAMVTFVEDTLSKSAPGTLFTMAVLASIANIPAPAKAAAIGAGAFKTGSTIFKWSSALVVLASFSGVIGSIFSVRAALDLSQSQQEKRRILQTVALFFLSAIIFTAGMFLLRGLAVKFEVYAGYFAFTSQLLVLAFVFSYLVLMVKFVFNSGEYRAEQQQNNLEAQISDGDDKPIKIKNKYKNSYYKSRTKFLGVPLIHFKIDPPEKGDTPTFAWIAGGESAYGLLFAWGCFAVAPVSVGVFSIGILSIGAIGIGILGLGTVAIGLISFGASAIGFKAYSSLSSLGWESAISGGFSMAREAAVGSFAFAQHANTDKAAEIANLSALNNHYLWVLGAMTVLIITPAVWHYNKVQQNLKNNLSKAA